MSQVSDQDVEAIKTWLSQEPSLPNTFDDMSLKKFLYSCHCSLERTKKCIEEFCTRRAQMPEIYTNRDPMSKGVQIAFSMTSVSTYLTEKDEVLIHQVHKIDNEFEFYNILKAFTLQADNWIKYPREVLPENHIVVLDIKLYTLSLLPKINIFYFQKFIMFLLESMPVRLKEVHVVNCPSFYEYMYNLVKPGFPEYLCKMIHFHSDAKNLHNHVDKKYLPKEYEGDNESMAEQHMRWVDDICDKRKLYLDDNFWKANLTNKTKNGSFESTMNGSFRTLSID